MQEFVIEGGHPLNGRVKIQGNKNEALPVLCATLMNPGTTTIANVPSIEDIKNLIKILEYLGASVRIHNDDIHNLEISVPDVHTSDIPTDLAAGLRGSVTLLAPVLARTGRVYLPRPGGDKIGRRRIDTHLQALEALGATVEVFNDGYLVHAEKLTGAEMLLDEASVTGTENAVMAAAVAEGITRIENAATEPHVQGLCNFLVEQGVQIDGIGSNILTIHGLGSYKKLKNASHKIGPDYLEIGSFVSMAALTGGEVTIEDVRPRDLRMIRLVFERLGIQFEYIENGKFTDLLIKAPQSMTVKTDVHGEIPKIDDAPWPAFPADLISIALVTATQTTGTVLIHEKLFESRLFFTDKLISMGARIVLCDPHRAVVIGPSKLYGAKMSSPDIRAGMSLVIAALAAEGVSRIQNILQIDRGYEKIDERLRALGAHISRVNS